MNYGKHILIYSLNKYIKNILNCSYDHRKNNNKNTYSLSYYNIQDHNNLNKLIDNLRSAIFKFNIIYLKITSKSNRIVISIDKQYLIETIDEKMSLFIQYLLNKQYQFKDLINLNLNDIILHLPDFVEFLDFQNYNINFTLFCNDGKVKEIKFCHIILENGESKLHSAVEYDTIFKNNKPKAENLNFIFCVEGQKEI